MTPTDPQQTNDGSKKTMQVLIEAFTNFRGPHRH